MRMCVDEGVSMTTYVIELPFSSGLIGNQVTWRSFLQDGEKKTDFPLDSAAHCDLCDLLAGPLWHGPSSEL